MVLALVIWYIVVGHPPGVLVFLWVSLACTTYFLITFPKFTIIAILTIVTQGTSLLLLLLFSLSSDLPTANTTSQVLILGYELEVKKVGKAVATSNGQPAYPTSLLAPYRLACVSGGMFVAFIWTFIPYPLTSRSVLRKDLGSSLYLLANFYSIVHTTCSLRMRGLDSDRDEVAGKSKKEKKKRGGKKSEVGKLDRARRDVYTKVLALLAGLRQHSKDTVWEPSFGGKFPRRQYDEIIQECQK